MLRPCLFILILLIILNLIVLAFRECSFLSKAVRAEELGAKAIIISDNDAESDDYYIEMVDDNTLREVHIPAAFLLGKNG